MPHGQLVPDTVQLKMKWVAGQAGERINSWMFANQNGWTETQGNALLDEVEVAYAAYLADFAPDAVFGISPLSEISLVDLGDAEGIILDRSVSIQGTVGAEIAPANCAAVVGFLTSGQGAPRRGRIFWPFVRETAVASSGILTSTYRTDLAAAAENFATDVAASVAGTSHVVVSRFLDNAERPTGVTKDVTGYVVRSVIGSQRDRRSGEGS